MISIQSLREPTQTLSSMQLAVLRDLLAEVREHIPAEPWRAHVCLDEIAALLGPTVSSARAKSGEAAMCLIPCQPVPAQEPEVTFVKGGLAPWQVSRVRRHIDSHIDSALPIEYLASLVQLSAGHFCRAFKTSLGEPPHAYITRQRIRYAQHLMMTTPDTLGAISIACGLADQAHLTRLFRKLVGTTPLVWRRTQRLS